MKACVRTGTLGMGGESGHLFNIPAEQTLFHYRINFRPSQQVENTLLEG